MIRTLTILNEVLPAAHDGRIDTLLVWEDAQQWGRYNQEERSAELHDTAAEGDEELINLAVIKSYIHGAAIFNVPSDELSQENAVAAVLRY